MAKEELLRQLSEYGDTQYNKWHSEQYIPSWNKMMDGKHRFDTFTEQEKINFLKFEARVNAQTEMVLSYLKATLNYNQIKRKIAALKEICDAEQDSVALPVLLEIQELYDSTN